jgi:hypothetical protein
MLAAQNENNRVEPLQGQGQDAEVLAIGSIRVSKTSDRDRGESRRTWLEKCSLEKLRKSQEEDQDISTIIRAKVNQHKPSGEEMAEESPAARSYWVLCDSRAGEPLCRFIVTREQHSRVKPSRNYAN